MSIHKQNIFELLIGLRRKIADNTKKSSLKDELTFSQFEVLWFIGLNGRKSMEEIAEYFKIAPPSATSMIHNMEKRGFVSRKKDSKDRRVVYITLTAKTKSHLKIMRKHKEKLFKNVVSKLSKKDKGHLEKIIKILIKN